MVKLKKRLVFGFPGAMLIGKEERKAAIDVINSKSLFRFYGPNLLRKVEQFEETAKKYLKVKHALGVNSCTNALIDALGAVGVGPGDEVIVPACTFIATVNAVVLSKGIPVFAEIDESLNLDPDDFEKKITPRTKAVVVVHLSGVAADMTRIMKVAKKHKIKVVEDCAQSFGAGYKGKKVGTFGDAGCFSLQQNKIITTGEGGLVATNDDNVYKRAMRFHDQGYFRGKISGRPVVSADNEMFFGYNMRMSELTGAVAIEQVKKLDRIIKGSRKAYDAINKETSKMQGITLRKVFDKKGDAGILASFYLPTIEKADKFCKEMEARNVSCFKLYGGQAVYMNAQVLNKKTIDGGCPFNCPKYGRKIEYKKGLCPKSEALMGRNVCFSIGPDTNANHVKIIVEAMKESLAAVS